MATISKFFLRDIATPNTGTMPGSGDAFVTSPSLGDATGDATGARTARDAHDTAGTSNPDVKSLITSVANTSRQTWGHRRFVSRPLAAQTFTAGDQWQFNYGHQESNTAHNAILGMVIYPWRPSTGAKVGTGTQYAEIYDGISEPGTTETAIGLIDTWNTTVSILDGDILVFEVSSEFVQSMSTSYTDQFSYDGTTESSTTTMASVVLANVPVTLLAAGGAAASLVTSQRSRRSQSLAIR
jgi:hypothetical protein